MRFLNTKQLINLLEQEEAQKKQDLLVKDGDEALEKSKAEAKLLELEEARNKAKVDTKNKDKSKVQVKEALVTEAIFHIYNKALGENGKLSADTQLRRKSLVLNFVQEQGANNLLRSMKDNSFLMNEYAILIENTYKALLEKSKENKEVVILDPEEEDEFITELDSKDADELSDVISDRVLSSIQDFIDQNQLNKDEIKNILVAAQEKIDGTVKESVQQVISARAKQKIDNINNRYKSIFEFMVENLSKKVYSNEQLQESYMDDSKINMDKIVETVTTVYTLLETVNTLELINIDNAYIEKLCNEF